MKIWPSRLSRLYRHALVSKSVARYSVSMPKLASLLNRLKGRQRDLIMEAAQSDNLPADSTLRRISELENAIAAVEAVADEEAEKAPKFK